MGWLTNWDDLVHGTVVFAAALPFAVAAVLARVERARLWWAAAAAVVVPLLWFFGVPASYPVTSDEAVVASLAAASVALVAESALPGRWWVRPVIRTLIWGVLA
jgi:hypothetical protein